MRFDDVRALVPYLRDLGISHLYLSPSLTARSGSTHGYDVVDPTTVSESLGGEDGAARAGAARASGSSSTSSPTTWAPATRTAGGRTPSERVRVFDVDPSTGHYRRFFDIDDLAGVRVEDPAVFSLTHDKVLSLVADGVVDGLRIDHPDGLADPAGYLERLRDAGAARVWIEKILHPGEAAARLARRGDRRLRVPQRRAGAVHRPGGRGAADGAVRVARRRRAVVRARSRSRRSSSRRATTFAREVRAAAAAARSRASWRRRSRGCPSTARTSRDGVVRIRRRPRRAGGGGPARRSSTARPRSSSRAFSRPRRR